MLNPCIELNKGLYKCRHIMYSDHATEYIFYQVQVLAPYFQFRTLFQLISIQTKFSMIFHFYFVAACNKTAFMKTITLGN